MRLLVSGSGNPAVILEAGAAADHRTWVAAQPALSQLSTVIRYDRLGHGPSGASPRPRTAAVIAEQLAAALREAHIEPPYVLVGHSFGAAVIRLFASLHPADVAALVLVDPALEGFYTRATLEHPQDYLAMLEEEILFSDREASDTVRREYLAYETSMLQTRLAVLPHQAPVILFTATGMELPPTLRQLWADEQTKWAARHPNVHQMLIDGGHRIPQHSPEAVTAAVRQALLLAGQAASTER
jgi:pimeloyl-ACP methyl ester carboxylesterase